MNCPECGNTMLLRFASRGVYAGKFFWGCQKYPFCKSTLEYIPKYPIPVGNRFMGLEVKQKLDELKGEERDIYLTDVKGRMIEILVHYVLCRFLHCYRGIYRYVILEHLDNDKVLNYFLKSNALRYGPSSIIISNNGAKIFYDLFYDFMLVKSDKIRNYLINEFPAYYEDFGNKKLPFQKYSFIDYSTNTLIDYGH